MSGDIQPIPHDAVHRIQSGQVVLGLDNALKELVENSLDAGSTSIEVRIKNNGLESIEVIDNGSGIKPSDWPLIGLKHHTSKLPSFDALSSVQTFGFRGEALSALCALSDEVTITTATREMGGLASRLRFDREGTLLPGAPEQVARQRGTTVAVTGLFRPLPVRRKEFERNAKREFAKAMALMTAYALVPCCAGGAGVRLVVDSVTAAGKKVNHLRTDGKPSLRSAVSSVWGPRALENLLDVELPLTVGAAVEGEAGAPQVVVKGLISSAGFGLGRTSADRQFLYINGRPISSTKIIRAINEVYRSFNPHQSPFVVLDLVIPRDAVDINVTPDKREAFVHREVDLIEALRAALEELYQPSLSAFTDGNAVKSKSKAATTNRSSGQIATPAEEEDTSDEDMEPESSPAEPSRMQLVQPSLKDRFARVPARRARERSPPLVREVAPTPARTLGHRPAIAPSTPHTTPPASRVVNMHLPSTTAQQLEYAEEESSGEVLEPSQAAEDEHISEVEDDALAEDPTSEIGLRSASPSGNTRPRSNGSKPQQSSRKNLRAHLFAFASQAPSAPAAVVNSESSDSSTDNETSVVDAEEDALEELKRNETQIKQYDSLFRPATPLSEGSPVSEITMDDVQDEGIEDEPVAEITQTARHKRMRVRCSIDRIRERNKRRRGTLPAEDMNKGSDPSNELEEADITEDSHKAEAALSRVIRKEDFLEMSVVGQFNNSFIIARLKKGSTDDLFIIDQHASDEKYNFETLQETTRIESQGLIQPRKLELTSSDEITAMDNLNVLEANGFKVAVDNDAPYGRGERISLLAMPISKSTVFDFKDLEEVIFLLQDRPSGTMVRCKKARAMFAMRACRKSVMFGKPLNKGQMKQVVQHLSQLDQPWNCPHGRPTLRHLINMQKSALPPTHVKAAGRRSGIDWSAVAID